MNREGLGTAERIIYAVLTYADHLYHGRPGVVIKDTTSAVGVKWTAATTKKNEAGVREVFLKEKVGNKSIDRRIGLFGDGMQVVSDSGQVLGEYRMPGIFPEVAVWTYRQIAEVWKMDNEFAARWASYAFEQSHSDMKVVLAAFMLSQSRKGDPVLGDEVPIVENGVVLGKKRQILFLDEDYRDVGEAMCLTFHKKNKGMDPKMFMRVHTLLLLPQIMEINRELGFGQSTRNALVRRWRKAAAKYLGFRERNVRILKGAIKAGFQSTIMEIARVSHYRPETENFFTTMQWQQVQAKDGRRKLAIGVEIEAAKSLEGMDERAICEWIVAEKPAYKRLIGMVPKSIGITRAVVSAAVESGCLSDKDLIIATPTLEELGLLEVKEIREKWEKATKAAEDVRAANIALRVKSQAVKEKLQDAADTALKNAVAETVRGLRVYFMVDCSGSMEGAIEKAKEYLAKMLQGFPIDQIHVSTFQAVGREVVIKHSSAAGVENAFKGIRAGGGTEYGTGVLCLQGHRPKPEEDVLFIFVGDEGQNHTFEHAVRVSNLNPMAFGLVPVWVERFGRGTAVRATARQLGIPCFEIDEKVFSDPYAIPRTLRNLVAATPVNQVARAAPAARETLVDTILKTKLLEKPIWATA